ncbi:hypothetical protein [Bradyrhizobium guangzhouense]|uniref:hypothetical protein n=1 Tax=Bradyrhizobium guangzhouense TaxID=1325095 RepID=UPI001009C30E|nr:hypothetical protein [Bradyrhizobium guangzhouense]RXH14739.1 hypothetical protein EAS54_20375 [Bradyrhizobium guangzhouense]
MIVTDDELSVLNRILNALQPLSNDKRRNVVRSLITLLGMDHRIAEPSHDSSKTSIQSGAAHRVPFSADLSISPKQFLLQKQPRTDVERVACLAFYLTHYRDSPHFKTLDLAKLNTEAAQPKFSNAAYAATNAAKMGYLAPAPKSQRQISAAGEQFVQALPDREAAKLAMSNARPRKKAIRKRK